MWGKSVENTITALDPFFEVRRSKMTKKPGLVRTLL